MTSSASLTVRLHLMISPAMRAQLDQACEDAGYRFEARLVREAIQEYLDRRYPPMPSYEGRTPVLVDTARLAEKRVTAPRLPVARDELAGPASA